MPSPTLLHTTGDSRADVAIQGIIERFEHAFPQRIVGYYVEGSYADGSAVATSDLDLTLVFAAAFASAAEQEHAQRVVAACQQHSTLELDITLTEEQQLQQHGADPLWKLGAWLLRGRDIREQIALVPITLWARQRMHAAFWLMINVFDRPQPVQAPLAWPQPDAPFYGYAARMLQLPDGTSLATTRDLVRVAGWIASARIAHEAQQYVTRKRDCAPTYRQTIGDNWTTLLDQIDQRCRTDWRYRIPDGADDQAELREIAHRMLAFENHFLSVYRRFLVAELSSADRDAQRTALQVLGRTFYADPAVVSIVHRLMAAEDTEVRAAACALKPNVTRRE